VFWRTEDGGANRDNIEAWCLECFANNFEAPRETVALLALDIVGYARMVEEHQRRALTLKSVVRDAAQRAAGDCRGRVVLDRLDDDLLMEFPTSQHAIKAARSLWSGFQEIATRLDLPIPELCGAIHCGEVTRWRNGLLAGDAVEIMPSIRSIAGVGQIMLTGPAAAPVREKVELEPITDHPAMELPAVGGIWAIRL